MTLAQAKASPGKTIANSLHDDDPGTNASSRRSPRPIARISCPTWNAFWTMSESGDHVNFLPFPTSGIVSLIDDLQDGSSSEIAPVGNEGMVGISIFMGGEGMPGNAVLQSEGTAFRPSRKVMKREFALIGNLLGARRDGITRAAGKLKFAAQRLPHRSKPIPRFRRDGIPRTGGKMPIERMIVRA